MFYIAGKDIKIHCVSSPDIIDSVVNNLSIKYGKVLVEEKRNIRTFSWDPGGSIRKNDVQFLFNIDESLSVHCYSQHFFLFKKEAEEQLRSASRYGDLFYKLHGSLFSLCLSKRQRDNFLSEIEKKNGKCSFFAKTFMEPAGNRSNYA